MTKIMQFLSLQGNDVPKLLVTAPLFLALGMGEVMGLSAAMSIFNVRYGVEHLPAMYVLEALVLLLTSGLIAHFSGVWAKSAFVKRAYATMGLLVLTNAIFLATARWGSFASPLLFYPFLLVTTTVIYFQMAPLIWLTATDISTTQQARRLFPLLSGCYTTGCILSGAAAHWLAPLGTEIIYLLWAVILGGGFLSLRECSRRYLVPLESSPEEEALSLGDSLRYLIKSPFLSRLLVLLTGLMLLYSLMDYQYNTVAESLFPDEKQLMAFFATLMAIFNTVAVVIEVGLLNKLMHWLGVGYILVVVPAGLAVCFLIPVSLFALNLPSGGVFISVVLTRLLTDVLGESSWQLGFKVVPPRERSSVRFLTGGFFILFGMLGGGALSLLHAAGAVSLPVLSAVGVLLGVFLVWMAGQVRNLYMRGLIVSVNYGYYDVSSNVDSALGSLVKPEILEAMLGFLHQPDDRKRGLAVELLRHSPGKTRLPVMTRLLGDASQKIRLAALQSFPAAEAGPQDWQRVLTCARDPDPELRAEAVLCLAGAGLIREQARSRLYEALDDLEVKVARAALVALRRLDGQLPPGKAEQVIGRCLASGPEGEVLACAVIGECKYAQYVPWLTSKLAEGEAPRARTAAAAALGQLACAGAIPAMLARYPTADLEYRAAVEKALRDMGRAALPVLIEQLRKNPPSSTWKVLIKTLQDFLFDRDNQKLALNECKTRVEQVQSMLSLVPALRQMGTHDLAELAGRRIKEIEAEVLEASWLVLAGLSSESSINVLRKALREENEEKRDNALAILTEGIGDRSLSQALAWYLTSVLSLDGEDPRPDALRARAAAKADYWLQEIWVAAERRRERKDMETARDFELLDRVLLLKETPLFAGLSVEELGLIASIARVETWPDGSFLLTEGRQNQTVYILLAGHIEISARSQSGREGTIGVMGTKELIGDTSAFDESPSPVSAQVILGDAVVLALEGRELARLCRLYPEIGIGLIRSISARVRRLEQMLILAG
ncbi:Cyclic AMP receptor protein [Pelotomaculum propionicicum]|uniref:ADP,ATP carrier protein n=2 Tax=Pelotomaculum propionicicum TaxID=258475 RepID=A0A4Y7RWM7_9FIRM|nr:Cyclic AMP receptor protein [Pelotomaculum propionicicum]